MSRLTQAEVAYAEQFITQVYFTYFFIRQQSFSIALCQYPSIIEDVGMMADTQHFPHVVVGDEDTNILFCQLVDC